MSEAQDEDPPALPTGSLEFLPREYVARELIGDAVEAIIFHDGERDRLRITTKNKLILTK
ncbi:hemin uptake protein HemP [Methylocystis sp. IM3]|uniref:hemin uptake protein HemP n=1 Tax=unclassified Methylocystis TaxID=2625913 RepID=UPI000F993353|nr:MAG: hemin uptake protein HemP [Hyphomicrobiales bacterium]